MVATPYRAGVAPTPLTIRPLTGPAEFPALIEIWRGAVEATHDFLDEADRQAIEVGMRDEYLHAVTVSVADSGAGPVGFSGVAGQKLEMLFIAESARGTGIGTTLLRHAISEFDVSKVDVNEQNTQALGFYEHHGFVVVGRSETDDAGRPYPILHLSRQGYLPSEIRTRIGVV